MWRRYPYNPHPMHECQNKGLAKWAIRKCLRIKRVNSVTNGEWPFGFARSDLVTSGSAKGKRVIDGEIQDVVRGGTSPVTMKRVRK
jgi:hypothetical protein